MSLLHSDSCGTNHAIAFDTHKVIAPIQMSEAYVLGSADRFFKRFHQVTCQVEHLHTHHRRYRLHHDQFVVRITEIEAVHLHSDNRILTVLAARRRLLVIGLRGTRRGLLLILAGAGLFCRTTGLRRT